ncbi:MAG: hypothetical protein ASARMPREDX12_002866 [Alectoria sarmentosa]|nr:MAG: hypothetical protein ASARMPREDX12_002866 [Alectoria sarmentosa]
MAAAKGFLLFLALLLTQIPTVAPQTQDHGYLHIHEQQVERRTVVPSTSSHLSSTSSHLSSMSSHLSSTTSLPSSIPILTIITIRATPIRITEQMQYVTSYSPIMTMCPLAGQALPLQSNFPVSGVPTAWANDTNATLPLSGILPRNPGLADKSILPRETANVSTCSIFWEPIPTPICHTTLSPLAAPLILVTACHQSVTFSSQFGYELAHGTTSPNVETLTTYYVAPWSDLSAGSVPTKGVIAEVCSSGRTDCTTGKERWDTHVSEYTQVTKKTVSVHTTVVGPVTVIIDPAINPITIGSGSPSSVYFTAVIETTETSTTTAITKASALSDEAAATSGVAMAGSTSLDFADEVATVSSTTTSTVTVVFASSTETLPLPTSSD